MAELSSETYSDEYVDQLVENLKWSTAIVAVLLQEAGGLVEIKQEVLEGINLNIARTTVLFDEDRKVYVIKGIYEDGS